MLILLYHFLNFDKIQIIKSNNTIDKTRVKIKCFKILVSNNINEKLIIIKQYVIIKIVDFIWEKPASRNLWWKWFLSAKNGLFPEITLMIITLIVSKKGKANKAKI